MTHDPKPTVLRVIPENIPSQLKDLEQWVLWRCEKNSKGKWTKVPYCRRGYAKSTDPSTWDSFENTMALYRRGGYDGIGICLAPGDGLVGVDLDKCIADTGELNGKAAEIAERFSHSYVEYSPSGNGLRIFGYGQARRCGKGGEGNWVEVYDHTSPRYLTITGNLFFSHNNQLSDIQPALDWLHENYTKKEDRPKPQRKIAPSQVNISEQEIIERARNSAKGAEFSALYDQGLDRGDPSSADLALCNSLAFWCGRDESLMDRIFRSSALMRDKWDEQRGELTYGQMTLRKAIADCHHDYDPNYRSGSPQENTPVEMGSLSVPVGREDWQQDLARMGANDEGNAKAVHLLYGKKFCYTDTYGWLHYNGKFWQGKGAESVLERAIVAALKQKQKVAVEQEDNAALKAAMPSAGNVRAAKFLFRSMVTRQIDEFDADYDLLNVANGALHLPTGELIPHSSEQSFTYCLKVAYHPNKDYAAWEQFLHGIVEVPEMVEYLQRCVGYSLTGHISEEVLWYIQGPTRSGKGTFTETIQELLGLPLCAEVQFGTFTRDRDNDANNFDLAPLKPCRIIFASESKKNQRLNAPKVKSLTGGNLIYCSFKRKDHFLYRPQYKIWLTSNHPVNADVDDDAVWGRLRCLRFPHSRLGQEDKSLKERMKSPDNLEAVLAWAAIGARRWYQTRGEGMPTPDLIQQITNAVREEQDYVRQWMEECISRTDKDCYLTNPEVYESYREWCEDNGVTPKKKASLTQALNSKGIEGPTVKKIVGKPKRVWFGLQLLSE